MARPSGYTPEIAEQICEALALGKSLPTICAVKGMPDISTVIRWLNKYPEFCANYARGREARADSRFESIDQVIQDMRDGKIDANQARVQIDAIKWQTGKEAPKRYGDKLNVEASGPNGGPIQNTVEVVFVSAKKDGSNGERVRESFGE